jgi:hypothetical protein
MNNLPKYTVSFQSINADEKPVPMMTPAEVKQYAFDNNLYILYRYCCMFEAGQLTWEQAMQTAAVHLAMENKSMANQLISISQRSIPAPYVMAAGNGNESMPQ